jgi:hypothetical protein
MLAFWAIPKIWAITGKGPVGFPLGLAIFYPVHVFVTFCISDVFWRLVDVPSVEFARWVESRCFS